MGGAHGICGRCSPVGLCGCFQSFFGPSPVEKGVSRARTFARRAVTCNHQVCRWMIGGPQPIGRCCLRWEFRLQAVLGFQPPGRKVLSMHDEKTVQRFIELRSQGRTYTQLMAELNVSKPTLIGWSRTPVPDPEPPGHRAGGSGREMARLRFRSRQRSRRATAPGRDRTRRPGCEGSLHPPALLTGPQPAPPD